MEGKFEIISGEDLQDLTTSDPNRLRMRLTFYQKMTHSGARFNVSASAIKPASDIDLRAEASYEFNGPNTDVALLLRYATDKDIAVTIFCNHPRGTFEHFEGRLNITVPSFSPMVLEGKLHEKYASDYDVSDKCHKYCYRNVKEMHLLWFHVS